MSDKLLSQINDLLKSHSATLQADILALVRKELKAREPAALVAEIDVEPISSVWPVLDGQPEYNEAVAEARPHLNGVDYEEFLDRFQADCPRYIVFSQPGLNKAAIELIERANLKSRRWFLSTLLGGSAGTVIDGYFVLPDVTTDWNPEKALDHYRRYLRVVKKGLIESIKSPYRKR